MQVDEAPAAAESGRWRPGFLAYAIGAMGFVVAFLVVTYLVLQLRSYQMPVAPEQDRQPVGLLRLFAEDENWLTNGAQQVLEDPSGTLTLEDVRSEPWQSRFAPWPDGNPALSFTSSAYWVRLHVENVSVEQSIFLLQLPMAETGWVSFYRSVEGRPYESVVTGALAPYSTREVPHPDFLFRLPLHPGERAWLYLRVAGDNLLSTPATLWTESAFLAYDGLRSSLWGAFYGTLTTLAIFHLFLFRSLKDRAYLSLSFLLVGVGLAFAVHDGRAHRFIWPGGGNMAGWLLLASVAWIVAGLLIFTRDFLNTRETAPRVDRLLKLLLVLTAMAALLIPFVRLSTMNWFLFSLALPTIAAALIAGGLALRQGYRPALLFIFALLPPLLIVVLDLTSKLKGVMLNPLGREGEAVLAVLALVLMALSMDDRINALVRESERALRALRQSELRLAQYMNAMPMLIDVRTADGALVFTNSAPEVTNGITELPDMSSLDAVARDLFVRTGSDEPYPVAALPFGRALAGQSGYADDIEVRHNDTRTPIEVWSSPVRGEGGEVERVVTAINNISRRRKTQTELDSLRMLYESIVQDQSVSICRFSASGNVLFANRAFARFFTTGDGVPAGTPLEAIVPDEAHIEQIADLTARLTPESPAGSMIIPYAHEVRGARWLHCSIRALFDADRKLSQYQAIVDDVTEAHNAEAMARDYHASLALQVEERTRELAVANRSLARRAEEIAAITGVAQALASTTNPDPVLQQVAGQLSRLFDAHGVGISVYDLAQQTRTLVAWFGTDPAIPPLTLGVTQPIRERVYRSRLVDERRTVFVTRDAQTPEVEQMHSTMARNDTRTMVVAPMLAHSEVVGDIVLETRREECQFADTDLRLLQTIAGQIAASLELGRLLASEQRERLRAEGMHEVVKGINRSLNPAVVIKTALDELQKVTQHDGSSIWLRDGDDLWMAACTGITLPWAGLRIDQRARSATSEVFRTRTLVAIDDVYNDPRWVHWFDDYKARSWLGAPMMIEDEVIGVLCIERTLPGARMIDAAPLQALADSAAIAVYNARLFDQAQAAAAAEERERLARDLHDAVTQTIFSASILAEALPLQLNTQPHRAEATVEKLQLLTRGALAEMRSLLVELRPKGLNEASLEILIRHLADALAGKSSIATTVKGAWNGTRLTADVQETFYRVAQEAMNNIAKHADATQVVIYLSDKADLITLRIEDNGRGFDPRATRPGHFGLQIMQERADAIGATLSIASQPAAGTCVGLVWRPNQGRAG